MLLAAFAVTCITSVSTPEPQGYVVEGQVSGLLHLVHRIAAPSVAEYDSDYFSIVRAMNNSTYMSTRRSDGVAY